MPEKNVKDQPRELTNKDYYWAILCSLPIFCFFAFMGRTDQGLGVAACFGVVFLAIRNRWNLRRHVWFWIAIACIVLIQVPIVVLIPWSGKGLTGRAIYPVAIVDGAIAYGCLKIAEHLIKKNNGTSSRS